MIGVAWALVAAVAFGFTQIVNRKANSLTDAFRTAFGLLVGVELVLLLRAALLGDLGLLLSVPPVAVGIFALSATVQFVGGWTLLALSQQRIGAARTGAVVSSAPVVGTLLAAIFLDEPVGLATATGVVLVVGGVALISLSGVSFGPGRVRWSRPWLALCVATLWGIGPLLVRLGLRSFDAPVVGLTAGLGVAVLGYAVGLRLAGVLPGEVPPRTAFRWLAVGGVSGAVALSAQWISFALTTVAIALTVQQLAALVVVGLAQVMFDAPIERATLPLLVGTVAILAGSTTVVLGG